ncbi:hypothetical protein HMPREF9135_0272 [Segatella baroniae F0067]|uniref:Uncharacterized protein n=1 Tax=Segatella baroniae F0067 TaxID=1115809 RepID=U2QFH3_9BACT|nr:hypothetical protein HMPREF9135_0272 [Segatella baroniae F0067]
MSIRGDFLPSLRPSVWRRLASAGCLPAIPPYCHGCAGAATLKVETNLRKSKETTLRLSQNKIYFIQTLPLKDIKPP